MLAPQLIGPDVYAAWRGSDLGEITEALEDRLLFRLLGDVAGRRVLEVGCGDGSLALALHGHGAAVTAIDPDPAMIREASARFRQNEVAITAAVGLGQHLPVRDGFFDVVLAKTVLCFVDDAGGMIDEMARVLCPGGLLVLGELGKRSSWAAQRRIRGWLGSRLWRRGRFRTSRELRQLAGAAGLDVQRLEGAVYYPRATWAARRLAPLDSRFARRTTWGAAFLAMSARKPVPQKSP